LPPSYEYTQTAGGLRGGTGLITPEGRAWGKQQLLNRIQELNAIDSGDYSAGAPKPVNLDPKLDYIDAAFSTFLDQWETGAFPGSLVEAANRCVQELFRVGATISPSKLAQYVEVCARLQVQGDRLAAVDAGRYTFKEEKRATIRAVILVLNRFQKLAEEIARLINEPQASREMALREIGSRILTEATAGQSVAGEQGGPFAPRPPYIPRR
jgi:hypothetical protein